MPCTASANKFQCRKAIAILKNYEEEQQKYNTHPHSYEARSTATVVRRMINVCFGPSFINRLLSLNDLKSCVDHETWNMTNDFWKDAAMVYNDIADTSSNKDVNSDEDDDDNDGSDDYIQEELEEDELLNLNDFNNLTPDVMRKKMNCLFTVQRLIKENMTVSGTHNLDAYVYLEIAMKKTKGASRMSKILVYYFCMRCEKHDNIDSKFSPFLVPAIQGSTADGDDDISDLGASIIENNKSNEKSLCKQSYQSTKDVANNSKEMLKEMQEYNKNSKKSQDLLLTIELAKAVNNQDVLNKLLEQQLTRIGVNNSVN